MRINSDYLGGDPDYPAGIKGGSLNSFKGGVFFAVQKSGLWAGPPETVLNYPARELRGVSFVSPEDKSLERAAKGAALGAALGGGVQGAAAGAYLGSVMPNHGYVLLVAWQRDEQMLVSAFTIKQNKINEFLAEIQEQRQKGGLARLPSVESLVEDGDAAPSAIGPAQLSVRPDADSPVGGVTSPGSYAQSFEATLSALNAMGQRPIQTLNNFITLDEQTLIEVHETYLIVRVLPLIDATPDEIMRRADVRTGPARFEMKEGVEFSTVRLPLPPDPIQTVGPITYFLMAAILSAMKLAAGRTEGPLD